MHVPLNVKVVAKFVTVGLEEILFVTVGLGEIFFSWSLGTFIIEIWGSKNDIAKN
jgi:hypothetical protein